MGFPEVHEEKENFLIGVPVKKLKFSRVNCNRKT